jgi:pyruvate kinase
LYQTKFSKRVANYGLNMKIERLCNELDEILHFITDTASKIDSAICEISKQHRLSAKNLRRYLMLRSYDLRKYHSECIMLNKGS